MVVSLTKGNMKKIFLSLLALGIIVYISPKVYAVVHSLNYTAAQDTIIQNQVITAYNRAHCQVWGKASGCSSANLVSGGCVVKNACQAIGLPAGTACTTLSTLNVESCVIYTVDTTGEDAMLQETANQKLVAIYDAGRSYGSVDFKAGFTAASQGNKDTACTAAGQATGCPGP